MRVFSLATASHGSCLMPGRRGRRNNAPLRTRADRIGVPQEILIIVFVGNVYSQRKNSLLDLRIILDYRKK
ncbi:hypothetical protein PSAC2689_50296 [Paraburkholderia sacchari]